MVTAVNGDKVTYTDCNGYQEEDGTYKPCQIRWGRETTITYLKARTVEYVLQYSDYSGQSSGTAPSGPAPEHMKSYAHNGVNYYVVEGFDSKYVIDQVSTEMKATYEKADSMCTVACDVMLAFIKGKITWDNSKSIFENAKPYVDKDWDGECTWNYSQAIKNSDAWTVDEKVSCVYEQVKLGNPVILRVKGHSVLAIGISESAYNVSEEVNPVKSADQILIINPYHGKIQTYLEMKNNGTHELEVNDGWSTRIPN